MKMKMMDCRNFCVVVCNIYVRLSMEVLVEVRLVVVELERIEMNIMIEIIMMMKRKILFSFWIIELRFLSEVVIVFFFRWILL